MNALVVGFLQDASLENFRGGSWVMSGTLNLLRRPITGSVSLTPFVLEKVKNTTGDVLAAARQSKGYDYEELPQHVRREVDRLKVPKFAYAR